MLKKFLEKRGGEAVEDQGYFENVYLQTSTAIAIDQLGTLFDDLVKWNIARTVPAKLKKRFARIMFAINPVEFCLENMAKESQLTQSDAQALERDLETVFGEIVRTQNREVVGRIQKCLRQIEVGVKYFDDAGEGRLAEGDFIQYSDTLAGRESIFPPGYQAPPGREKEEFEPLLIHQKVIELKKDQVPSVLLSRDDVLGATAQTFEEVVQKKMADPLVVIMQTRKHAEEEYFDHLGRSLYRTPEGEYFVDPNPSPEKSKRAMQLYSTKKKMNSQLVSFLDKDNYRRYYDAAMGALASISDLAGQMNKQQDACSFKIILGGGTGMSMYFAQQIILKKEEISKTNLKRISNFMFQYFKWGDLDFKIKVYPNRTGYGSHAVQHQIEQFQKKLDLFLKTSVCQPNIFKDVGVPLAEGLVFEKQTDREGQNFDDFGNPQEDPNEQSRSIKMHVDADGNSSRTVIHKLEPLPLKYDVITIAREASPPLVIFRTFVPLVARALGGEPQRYKMELFDFSLTYAQYEQLASDYHIRIGDQNVPVENFNNECFNSLQPHRTECVPMMSNTQALVEWMSQIKYIDYKKIKDPREKIMKSLEDISASLRRLEIIYANAVNSPR